MPPDAKAREEIARQAAEWLVRLDAGTADPAAFALWRDASPHHASLFAQTAATWKNTGDLRWSATPPIAAPPPDAALHDELPLAHGAPGFGRRFALGAIAASLVAIGTGTAFWLGQGRNYAETAVGERRTVQLPGGSRVELNTLTRIAWQMDDMLELWIEHGEAAINVGPGTIGSVIVHAGSMRALLDGGQYLIRLLDQGPRLTVIAGKAVVASATGVTATLLPDQVLRESSAGLTSEALSAADRQQAEAWQSGEIVFDGMPLSEALSEFNRYLPRPLMLADPALGSTRLGGRFRTTDPEGFLQSLEESFGIRNRPDGERILLFGQAGPA